MGALYRDTTQIGWQVCYTEPQSYSIYNDNALRCILSSENWSGLVPLLRPCTDIEFHVISFLIQSIHITSIVLLCIDLIDGLNVSSLPTWAVL